LDMGLTAEESGLDSWQWKEIIPFSTASRLAPRLTQPPIQQVPEALAPVVKRHSPPSSAKVKNTWIHTSSPHTTKWWGAQLNTGTTSLYFNFFFSQFSHFLCPLVVFPFIFNSRFFVMSLVENEFHCVAEFRSGKHYQWYIDSPAVFWYIWRSYIIMSHWAQACQQFVPMGRENFCHSIGIITESAISAVQPLRNYRTQL
jgi:hypothetical protein